ncbi:MAG: helix-turn-helix transcriptional regulator [Andreesenia angusta]|nr:helix-turn-helix transcriptional regulator [Andreesenia angusta]
MDFANKLRILRQEKNLTQAEAAKLIDVSIRTYKGYELGERLPRDRKTYLNIADKFDVNLDYLMDSNQEFIVRAREKYGSKGAREARELAEDLAGLFAGGKLDEEDRKAVLETIQEAYYMAKLNNKKYTPKKYSEDE